MKPQKKLFVCTVILLCAMFLCLNTSCANNKKMDNAENNKQDDTIYINDMHINDFKFIVSNVHLNHEQFKTNNSWNREICSPVLDTDLKSRFRTILNNAATMEPNFDGKYRIITYGAGAGTTGYFILDLNTGSIYESNSFSYFGMDYNVISSLLIINPPMEVIKYWESEHNVIPGWVQVEYLAIMNGKPKTLLLINPASVAK